MVRPAKGRPSTAASNPELEQRSRLKWLAVENGMFSESAAECQAPLRPSKAALKHHGKDIIKKSLRKNRFLFSFPGLLGPITGGKIGELKDLGTKNPILYLDFPQGQMKLFGTIVYPKNRYLTLQFSRGGKNVMCEDYFDNMDDGPSKKRTTITGKGAGGKTTRKGKEPKVQDDDIQEISSSSETSDGSGEEWAA